MSCCLVVALLLPFGSFAYGCGVGLLDIAFGSIGSFWMAHWENYWLSCAECCLGSMNSSYASHDHVLLPKK